MKFRYYSNIADFRLCCTIGIILLATSQLFQSNFYYIYYYFFACAFIIYIYRMKGLISLDRSGITFFYGFLRQKEINLRWEDIFNVKIEKYDFKFGGGADCIMYASDKMPCLVLSTNVDNLKPLKTKAFFTDKNRLIFFDSISWNYEILLQKMQSFIPNKIDYVNVKHHSSNKLLYAMDVILIGITVLLIITFDLNNAIR